MIRGAKKYPLLRCPVCGEEYQPTMHGWAFQTSATTKCKGKGADHYSHPFQVVAPDLVPTNQGFGDG